MRQLLLLTISCLLVFSNLQGQDIPDDYVAYWSFDNHIDEVPDLGANPSYTNTFGLDRFNNPQGAIYFDGNERISYSPTPATLQNLPANDYSVSVWVKEDNVSGLSTIFSAFHSGKGYILRTADGTFSRDLLLSQTQMGGTYRSDDGLTPQQWQHLAVTFNSQSGEAHLYINGIEVVYKQNDLSTAAYLGDGTSFQIGSISTGLQYFRGYLDDLYIFNRIITSDEIAALLGDGSGSGDGNGLVANWPLYENANDIGPNLFHGTPTGASPSGGAYTLDGTSDFIDLSSPFPLGNLPLNDFNISAWVLDERTVSGGTIFASSSNFNDGWYVYTASDGAGGKLVRLRIFYDGGSVIYETTTPFSVNEWTHVAVNYTANTKELEIYLNGESIPVTESITGTLDSYKSDAVANKYIGNRRPANPYLFQGSLRDIYLYNRKLSLTEVEILAGVYEAGQSLWKLAGTNNQGGLDIYYDTGNVGIGTSTIPEEYNLAVAGKIISSEVKVSLVQNWPDFVFEEGYELLSLSDIEEFIKKHHHLPNIPSEAQVSEEGFNVGGMNARLLQKIEELTLHMIEMNKKFEKLNGEVQDLRKENKTLKSMLKVE